MNYCKILLLVLMVGCQNKNPEKELRSFVEEPANKITQKITIGDVGIVTRFMPKSYRFLMKREKDSMQDSGEQFYYFDVKFSKKMTEKIAKEKLLYLNFDMQNDFVLHANNRDSIMPSICQKIENGVADSYEYIVVFEKGKREWKDFTLYYHDEIFNIGTVAFVYNQQDILKIPGIKNKD